LLKDSDVRKDVDKIRQEMKGAVVSIREELDVHLDTINQNTDEIQQNYEYLATLESKMDKLAERLDALEALLSPGRKVSKIDLSLREQEVFLVLYSCADKLSKKAISRKVGLTDEMVDAILANMVAKGVPVLKQTFEGESLFFLDFKFRELQAKHKVVPIQEAVVKELFQS
jgi:hypothetical protein